ncbi:hypothetical protein CVT26_012064 [Gymnopilus dilepis]|uniref:Uncharacterized protein n=1 Tax=Gymnopilus dilepis TaxID=231916 RepID=A0A409X220_9AGAR|nr:hypothetical protein CVT26_012064 [Gymnopilus dilepis]
MEDCSVANVGTPWPLDEYFMATMLQRDFSVANFCPTLPLDVQSEDGSSMTLMLQEAFPKAAAYQLVSSSDVGSPHKWDDIMLLTELEKTSGQHVEVKPIQASNGFNFAKLLRKADDVAQETFLEPDLEGEDEETEDAAPVEGVVDPTDEAATVGVITTSLKRRYDGAFSGAQNISRSHRRRKLKQDEKIVAEGHMPNAKALQSLLKASKSLETNLDTEKLPATSCGTQACHYHPEKAEDQDLKLEKLLAEGYQLITSDPKIPRPIVDAQERVVAAFCGHMSDPKYLEACEEAYRLFTSIGEDPGLREEAFNNRRGFFPVINIGITHGKGTTHPVNLHERKDQPSKYEDLVQRILQNPDLNRIATFQSSCFRIWYPNVYQYYHDQLNKLFAKLPYLKRNFQKSAFPCCAVNCGPKAWTCRHRDSMNLPFGACAITALGKFDHRTGGHLVLPDLKLIIEFPVGCVILIPSATLVHANIPIQDHEFRASFTQFAAGGLFRFVENDFMTEKALKRKDKKRYKLACVEKATRWAMGLNMLSKLSDLVESERNVL